MNDATRQPPAARPSAPRWHCPLCRQPLLASERRYACASGHSFDPAREGYLNLLPAHRKHSAEPGDSKAMLISRRKFLEAGHYQPLAQRLAELAGELRNDDHFALLDSGCGEGWYSGQLAAALHRQLPEGLALHAIDIARDAMRMAAKRYPQVHFAVASNAALPLGDAALQLLLRVFAPGSDAEVARVLAPGGHFVVVNPGPEHLFALRQLVYRDPRRHDTPQAQIDGLEHVARHAVQYPLALERPGEAARLLAMTPYYWRADADTQARIAALQRFATPVDFCIDVYRKP